LAASSAARISCLGLIARNRTFWLRTFGGPGFLYFLTNMSLKQASRRCILRFRLNVGDLYERYCYPGPDNFTV
jgi:hypothetical protein